MRPTAVTPRIVFQPLFDLSAWTVVGFEALARFSDGRSPAEHLRLAEAAGNRGDLELELILLAVEAATFLPPDVLVTVNASGTTIMQPAFVHALDIGARVWGIELYEGSPDEENHDVRERVSVMGSLLLIDDAGLGAPAEPRILELAPDIVKIDRAVFWAAMEDPAALASVLSIIDASHHVDARVLIEGVETAAHLDFVRSLSVDLVQGYLFGMPTAPAEVAAMLDDLFRRVGVDAPRL